MKCFTLIVLVLVASQSNAQRKFPDDFKFGTGTSAYQIEGAWNVDGKGESIWDYFVHNHPERIVDNTTGDVACDSYNLWRRDVEMLKELGVNVYRFSIAWTRIMPTGISNEVNQKGLDYYGNLIDELLENGITPFVVLHHYDLPQRLQEIGGWTNSETIGHFKEFARVVFKTFGDRVKWWATFNEPYHVCRMSYDLPFFAPGFGFPGVPGYLCGHNVLLAHAAVVQIYRSEFQGSRDGKIGLIVDSNWPEPESDSLEDQAATDRYLRFSIGWFMHPIYSASGNYPPEMITRIATFSAQQGFAKSRLPVFTAAEIAMLKGSSDFFGINTVTASKVYMNDAQNSANFKQPSYDHDCGIVSYKDESWPETASAWFRVYPDGIFKLLMWIKKEYNNPEVYVTQNGYSDHGETKDELRVKYYKDHLNKVLDAIDEGCNVKGYIAWSLMDNFGWSDGFKERFGLYYVDQKHPNKTRVQKSSARFYADVIQKRMINMDLMPEPEEYTPWEEGSGSMVMPTMTLIMVAAAMVIRSLL